MYALSQAPTSSILLKFIFYLNLQSLDFQVWQLQKDADAGFNALEICEAWQIAALQHLFQKVPSISNDHISWCTFKLFCVSEMEECVSIPCGAKYERAFYQPVEFDSMGHESPWPSSKAIGVSKSLSSIRGAKNVICHLDSCRMPPKE